MRIGWVCLLVTLTLLIAICNTGSPIPPYPGTLILTMLTRDEAANLDRTLPVWAKIVDYWIIGVDEYNTDNSEEIIKLHLGHIPGEIVTVKFDGMGPTWTVLVERGLERFPQATHGILADADFRPMQDSLNKWELDVRCSKHMFTVYTEDHSNARQMDWIYRNIPGVRVTRRTHQVLEVPELPNQEVYQTLIHLEVDEKEGFQDRTGKKSATYLRWLELDLEDHPGDARTLYYIGHAHWDIFIADNTKRDHLHAAHHYFQLRADVEGNFEERWFARLKVAEMNERFYGNWSAAEYYYKLCLEQDPPRADPWFYIGQHYRLTREFGKAMPWLREATSLPIPQRALFMWHYLYTCLAHVEFIRAAQGLQQQQDLTAADRARAKHSVKHAMKHCEVSLKEEVKGIGVALKQSHYSYSKGGSTSPIAATSPDDQEPYLAIIASFLEYISKVEAYLHRIFISHDAEDIDAAFQAAVAPMREVLVSSDDVITLTCRQIRKLTQPFLNFYKLRLNEISDYLEDDFEQITELETQVHSLKLLCRR